MGGEQPTKCGRWSCHEMENECGVETVRRWEELREETQPESIALATELELTRSVNTEAFSGEISGSLPSRGR